MRSSIKPNTVTFKASDHNRSVVEFSTNRLRGTQLVVQPIKVSGV